MEIKCGKCGSYKTSMVCKGYMVIICKDCGHQVDDSTTTLWTLGIPCNLEKLKRRFEEVI